MPRGDKPKYSGKQKRQAEKIEEGYEERGVPEQEAERRAWATVNKMTKGGKKPGGSGRGKSTNTAPAKKGGSKGGKASSSRSQSARATSSKQATKRKGGTKGGKSSASRSQSARATSSKQATKRKG